MKSGSLQIMSTENGRSRIAIPVAKPGLTVRKSLLYVWWDWKGAINYDLYCKEMANRRGIVFIRNFGSDSPDAPVGWLGCF